MFNEWNSRAVSMSEVVRHRNKYKQIWAFLSVRSVGIYSDDTQKFLLYIEMSGEMLQSHKEKYACI